MDVCTYVRTDGRKFETHFIRSTQKSQPKMEINTLQHPSIMRLSI